MTICVVIDSNVLISYLLNLSGTITEIVDHHWRQGHFVLLTFPELIAEVAGVVSRPNLSSRVDVDDAAALLSALYRVGELQDPLDLERMPAYTRDSDDDLFVAYALAGEADFLVSGDKDLLVLGQVDGLRIVTPAEFLSILAYASP